jgi:hypothetical protein
MGALTLWRCQLRSGRATQRPKVAPTQLGPADDNARRWEGVLCSCGTELMGRKVRGWGWKKCEVCENRAGVVRS